MAKAAAAGCGAIILLSACIIAAIVLVVFFMNTRHPEKPGGGLPPQVTFPEGDDPQEDPEGDVPEEDPSTPPGPPVQDVRIPDVPASERGNRAIESFSTSKRALRKLHREAKHERTFYCGCAYRDRSPRHGSCEYKVRRDPKRAGRIEWEHVVPASRFGRTFQAWTPGDKRCRGTGRGRSCAEEVSRDYRLMQADLYNLQPAIGEVNGARSNFPMGVLTGEEREFGACDVEIRDRTIEPAPAVRGDIARTYLYMDWAYPGRINLTPAERAMFQSWHRADPPDRWEIERAQKIRAIQKNQNPYLSGR